jgi:dihydrofolate synthase/folylpolyglutamate synthase
MADLLRGAPVAQALIEELVVRIRALVERGVTPTLAIVRVGERPDDLSYERAVLRRAGKVGVAIRRFILPADCSQEELVAVLAGVNEDASVHGCLMFRPLPRDLDEEAACAALEPAKDVDCATTGSLAGVFAGRSWGFPPCTAEAVVRLLEHYGHVLSGASVCVVGRSLVIGRPVAMMLQAADATVTMCHTKTRDLARRCREAEVLVVAAGHPNTVRVNAVRAGQVVVDVGVNWDEGAGKLVGDVAFDEVEPLVGAITPVPGGVGAVTTAVLCAHVIEAAERALDGRRSAALSSVGGAHRLASRGMAAWNMAYEVPFSVPAWTYDQALGRLHQALHFGIQPMLESVEDMLVEAGDPDLAFDCVQIAGTNGKTSTARYTAAILAGEGLRTALYTSPELVDMNERMEVSGAPVSRESFARGIAVAATAAERVNARRSAIGARPYDITEFDLLTVASLAAFAEAGVDVCVLECGMGGRWDATSAARSIRSVAVTGIGLDHMRILGDTLEKIAGEKAAIIKRGRTCVLGVGTATPDTMEDVFLEQCVREGVTPTLLRPDNLDDAAGELHPGVPRAHEDLPHASYLVTRRPGRIGGALVLDVQTLRATYREVAALKPTYQAANVACAVALAEDYLGRPLDERALADSVVSCPTPGRFDVRRADPLVLVDACHNPQSVETFLTAVRQVHADVCSRPTLLCAVLADKDVEGIVGLLAPEFPRVVCAQTSSPRALAAGELARAFERAGVEPLATCPTITEALALITARGEECVACGSITTAGEVSALLS